MGTPPHRSTADRIAAREAEAFEPAREVTRATRKDVLDLIRTSGMPWRVALDDGAFLGRVWPLDALPSTDSRCDSMAEDVRMHTYWHDDQPDDWIYNDGRLDLLGCPDGTFLAFVTELVHPIVRPDDGDARQLVAWFNDALRPDGFELAPARHLRGRPVYVARRQGEFVSPDAALDLDQYPQVSDRGVLHEHLRRIQVNLDADPPAAVASSKELVESVLRIIAREQRLDVSKRADLLELYKAVAADLKLNAEAVPGDSAGSASAQKTLRSLVTTIQSLAELRNSLGLGLGLGHGRDARSAAFARHARLAFHAALAVSDFLLATWHERLAQLSAPDASR